MDAAYLRKLDALDLHPLACWGGGKTLPGTDHRALGDAPPSLDDALSADYSGGMAILCGTARRDGWTLGLDVDHGPESWPAWPLGTLLVERGTSAGKWHLFIAVTDRLDGQATIFEDTRAGVLAARWERRGPPIAVELKGHGYSLRSWPTVPQGKPRGYTPAYIADAPGPPPALSARQLADALTDYCHRSLGMTVCLEFDERFQGPRPRGANVAVSGRVARAVERELEAGGARLKPRRSSDWVDGHCPFHEDAHASFSVNFVLGCYLCRMPGCGSGQLSALARRLGLKAPRAAAAWEVRG